MRGLGSEAQIDEVASEQLMKKCRCEDSNLRQRGYEPRALASELHRQNKRKVIKAGMCKILCFGKLASLPCCHCELRGVASSQ